MKVIIYKDAQSVALAAAMVFAAALYEKPNAVFGLATGGTPEPLYAELVRMNTEGLIDFSKARTFNLDEYVGLAPDHPASYRRFMNEKLFSKINIDPANTHVPSGVAPDLQREAAEYDAAIERTGGIDVQLLGIGVNGHIGFNEPSSVFPYATNIVDLTPSTIDANKRYFESADEVPRRAISMGVGTIMAARKIVLIATGGNKADAICWAVKGEIDPQIPASILRCHADALVFLDEAAASKL